MIKGDRWIKIHLNIFEVNEKLNSVDDLKDCDGINFHLPPNHITKMRLRSDDYKGPPLFYMIFLPEYKLGKINSQSNFQKEVSKLRELVKKDMANIDSFVKRWHELHKYHVVYTIYRELERVLKIEKHPLSVEKSPRTNP